MKTFVFLLLSLSLLSCKMSIYFVGNKFPKTNTIDIWIDSSKIKKPFEIIGYAGIDKHGWASSVEKQTNKYIVKAKDCGADGILFLNYSYVQYGTFIHNKTIQTLDTMNKVNTINQNSSITTNPIINNQSVYFIKYQ